MQTKRKFISLICALSMLVSLFSAFTVNAAATINTTLKIVSSTDKQVVLDVGYEGIDTLNQFSLNIPVDADLIADNEDGTKNVAVDYTEGFAASSQANYGKRSGAIILTGAKATGMTDVDHKIATVTINFNEAITEDIPLTFTKADFTDGSNVEYGLSVSDPEKVVGNSTVVVEAPEVPLPEVNKGIKLTLVPAECAANKVVFDVTYVGISDTINQFSLNIPVNADLIADTEDGTKNVAVDYTEGFAASCQANYGKRSGAIILTGAKATGMTDADHKIARVTINLAADLADTLLLELTKSDVTDNKNVEYGYAGEGEFKLDASALRVKPSDLVTPVETEVPGTDAPATEVPGTDAPATEVPGTDAPVTTAMPRPTAHVIATEVPTETEAPVITETPVETEVPAEPDAEVNKGVKLTLVPTECAANKVVFDVTYVGISDTINQFSLNIPVDADLIADNEDGTKNVAVGYTEGFAASCQANYGKRSGAIILTGAKATGMTDADHKIARVTINLAKDLADTLKLELTKSDVTNDKNVEYGYAGEGEFKLNTSYINVTPSKLIAPLETEAPATEAPATEVPSTDAPVTPVPVVTTVPMTDVVDVTKVAEVEKNNEGVPTIENPSKAFIILDTEAVYGKDYVAVIGDKELTKEEFENKIWGYDGTVEDAVKDIKLNILTEDTLKLVSALNDAANNVLVEEKTVEVNKKETTKPTAAPDLNGVKFQGWSPNAISVSKNSTKQSVATFENIPEDAKNIEIEFYVDDTDLVKITSGSTTTTRNLAKATVKATAKRAKKDSTTVSAELTYTLNGEKFTVLSTKDLTVKTTSSTGGSGTGGSGTGGSGGIIAGPNTGSTTLWPGGVVGKVNFQDLAQAPWAEDAITFLAERGIVNGRSATAFEPMGEITRAEFAKLVVTIYGINVGEGLQSTVYPDVVSGEWYTPYVAAAAQYGIVTGYPDGMFRPNALVSRQEMAVMMYRAITTFRTQLPTINQPKTWSDEIPAWSADAINALQVAGVMNGVSDTEFGATDASTRAMAAQMIYNLYNVVD